MSITIDFFFNFPDDKKTLLKEIEKWIGCIFLPYEGDHSDLFCRFIGMECSFEEHALSNDGDLDFQNFQFMIGIRTPAPDADFRPLQLVTMASIAYALFKRLGTEGILVFDVQTVIARYKRMGDLFFDHVSKKVVKYPEHITDLFKRIPERFLDLS